MNYICNVLLLPTQFTLHCSRDRLDKILIIKHRYYLIYFLKQSLLDIKSQDRKGGDRFAQADNAGYLLTD